MSNIIGNPFDSYVTNQINNRQSALGRYTNIDADDLKYYTTKTPWLRLASSVNIEGETINGQKDGSVYWKLKEAGFTTAQILGDNLAKNFILFGGTTSAYDVSRKEDGETVTISKFYGENVGLNYGATLKNTGEATRAGSIGDSSLQRLFTGAYGWGGVSERGYVPMPGIESAQTTYYNNGALSKATINIKCYSKAQFSLLDVLYLRPGYTLLLEFGHSVYFNPLGNITSFNEWTSNPLNFLLNPASWPGSQDQYYMFDLIRKERKAYAGNYEAVYGKISNFKWSFNADGSYSISVELIGMGSIMDSLKLNVTDPKKSSEGDSVSSPSSEAAYYEEFWGEETAAALLQRGAENIKLFNFNDRVQSRIKSVKVGGVPKFKIVTSTSDSTVKQVKSWTNKQYNKRIKEDEASAKLEESNSSINPLLNDKDATRLNKKFYQIYQKFVTINPETEGFSMAFVPRVEGVKNGGCYINNTYNGEANRDGSGLALKSGFIKFAVLLKLIEDNCNLFSKKNKKKSKLLKFDMSYGDGVTSDLNYMLLVAPHLSTNPQICLVPFTKAAIPGVITFKGGEELDLKTDGAINTMLIKNSDFVVEGNPNAGRLANLMINLRFAAGALKSSSKDSNGNISIISYVQTILQGVNESLGSINNFRVISNDENGMVTIYDESPIPGVISKPNEYATFNIFGLKRGNTPTGADGTPENDSISGASQNTTGSFITNIGLDAEIPSNFATLISIGSQNARDSGTNLQGNASSFANYNKGLVDRIIPTKLDAVEANKDNAKPKPVVEAKTIFKNKIYGFGINSPFQSVYSTTDPSGGNPSGGGGMYNFHPDTTRNFTENYTSYLKIIHGISAQRGKIPQPFFLPFNLNLEMDGLSGMKLFEKFRITDDILPPSYEKDSVDIIIKGINHSVDINSWKTTLDTLSVPRFIAETKISGSAATSAAIDDQQKQLEDEAKGEEESNNAFQQYVKDTAWSAAFISYVIKEAGVNFPYQGNHANYSQDVRVKGKSAAIPWAAKNPETTRLSVGDIVVFNRAGNNLNYNTPVWKGSSHGDIVTEVNKEQGYVKVIGGNVSDTVKIKTFPIYKKNGRLKSPSNFYAVLRAGQSKWRKKIAAGATKEHLNFASKKDYNPEVEDILYAYYQAGKLDAPNPRA
tara:strand:- start:1562 stop:5014 length:3453 start_codon:yes stop_codon:yes gene_type:complete